MKSNIVSILKVGKIVNIPETELRKGDILLLQAGDLVSADVKVVEAKGLEVDEFDLTGEIMPVDKKVDKEDVFVYKGSRVTRGNGKGLVVATGEETEYGKILKQRWGQLRLEFPPLTKGRYFVLLALLLPPLIVSVSYYGDLALVSLAFFVIGVFVLLLQNGGLFKYLLISSEIKGLEERIKFHDETSLESIGKADVVCFDKTGVLTTRNIEVKHIHFADGSPDLKAFVSNEGILELTKTALALCNDVLFLEKINQADPIDQALILFALKNGVDATNLRIGYERNYEKPFDSENRYMAAGFASHGKQVYFAKGDPEVILKMCEKYVEMSGEEKKVDLDFLTSFKSQTNFIDAHGDRAIALAYSPSSFETPPQHYIFLCLIQLENPLKPGASEVVKALKEMDVRPLIVTGDKPETALRIASTIGIGSESDYCLTGRTMERMDFSEVARQSDHISVYARLLPSQKGILVRLLQQRNSFVVMVGDGANDTVALKVADVGISFREDSSPFARRVSKFLINDLPDLMAIFQSGCRIKRRVNYLLLVRIMLLASVFLVLYLQTLNLVAHLL